MFAMAKYQQLNPYNNLQYWYEEQQAQKAKEQEQQKQLEQQGYVKKKGCNCGGNKKKY